jgi:5-methylcytosine-specific restriction endonuclease McrA
MSRKRATALERISWRLLWVPGSDLHEAGVLDFLAMLAFVIYAHEPVGNVVVLGLDERSKPIIHSYVWDDNSGRIGPSFHHQNDASAHVVSVVRGEDPGPLQTEIRRLRRLSKDTLRKELALRHGWVCHICGRPIPRRYRAEALYNVAHPDGMFPDIEHVVPLRFGGIHWWPNLRLAHRACNLRKRDRDATLSRDINATLKGVLRYVDLPAKDRNAMRERFLQEDPWFEPEAAE